MIKIFKSNKFISILLIIICIIIIFNPAIYLKSCLNGVSVWAFKVMPLMFPFFVLTKMIASLNPPKPTLMDKFFKKAYNSPNGSALTYFLSVLAGYPMGAKLICELYNKKHITTEQSKSMLSYCSVSGPIFMIGTVGVSMLLSFKAGLIIFIANVLGSLLNGVLYRIKNKTFSNSKQVETYISHHELHEQQINNLNKSELKNINFADCVYDSLISVLMIGCYIILSFILIDMLENFNVFSLFNTLSNPFNTNHSQIITSILKGLIEITRGIYDLSGLKCSLTIKTIISSGIIGFGGISVLLQSLSFLNGLKLSSLTIIKQKITQALFTTLISIPLALLFL